MKSLLKILSVNFGFLPQIQRLELKMFTQCWDNFLEQQQNREPYLKHYYWSGPACHQWKKNLFKLTNNSELKTKLNTIFKSEL